MSTARRTVATLADLRMEMVARVAAGAALVVVLASFAYSFAQITWVSEWALSPQAWALNLLLPFIIDLPALVASALTVALHDRPVRLRAYAWSVLVVFTSASWVCNAVHAVVHSQLPARAGHAWWSYLLVVVIAGFPPIGVVLGMHLWSFALRWSAAADARAPQQPAAAPARVTPAPARPARVEAPAPRARTSERILSPQEIAAAQRLATGLTGSPTAAPESAQDTARSEQPPARSAQQPARADRVERDPQRQAVFEEYRARLAADPEDRMDGKEIAARIGITNEGNARNIRRRWDAWIAEEEAERAAVAQPEEPREQPADVEPERAPERQEEAAREPERVEPARAVVEEEIRAVEPPRDPIAEQVEAERTVTLESDKVATVA